MSESNGAAGAPGPPVSSSRSPALGWVTDQGGFEGRAAAGVYALGQLGGRLRGALVPGERSGAGPGRGAVVRDAVVDRSGLPEGALDRRGFPCEAPSSRPDRERVIGYRGRPAA